MGSSLKSKKTLLMSLLALVLDQELAIASVVASTASPVSVVLVSSVSTPVVPPALEQVWLLTLFQGSPPLLERLWLLAWQVPSTLLLLQIES